MAAPAGRSQADRDRARWSDVARGFERLKLFGYNELPEKSENPFYWGPMPIMICAAAVELLQIIAGAKATGPTLPCSWACSSPTPRSLRSSTQASNRCAQGVARAQGQRDARRTKFYHQCS